MNQVEMVDRRRIYILCNEKSAIYREKYFVLETPEMVLDKCMEIGWRAQEGFMGVFTGPPSEQALRELPIGQMYRVGNGATEDFWVMPQYALIVPPPPTGSAVICNACGWGTVACPRCDAEL